MFTEKRSKYNATKKTVDGIKFDSTKEANRYSELKLLQHYGYIKDLQCQVKYELIPKQLKRNGKYERAVFYIADFVYMELKNQKYEQVVEDVKGSHFGMAYALYVIKRKLMLWIHKIEIREV